MNLNLVTKQFDFFLFIHLFSDIWYHTLKSTLEIAKQKERDEEYYNTHAVMKLILLGKCSFLGSLSKKKHFSFHTFRQYENMDVSPRNEDVKVQCLTFESMQL